ncbi:MAG: OpgC family protein [Hyphomicrobiaceae bacterium]
MPASFPQATPRRRGTGRHPAHREHKDTEDHLARQANPVDFWRGFALIAIFVNHIPGIYYEHFTHRNYAISDAADLFVFLAGWSLRLAVGRPEDPTPTSAVMLRLGNRALTIYAAQILIISIAIAMLAASARLLDNPLLLEWHNAAAVFYDPVNAHIGLVLLTHQLGYFDILPLYVVLMMMAPAFVLIHRYAPDWLLPISLLIYLTTLIFRIQIPSWPTNGTWFFNPLAWQLIFVLGFSMAREHGIGGWVRSNIKWIRLVSIPLVIYGALAVWFRWWPDPTQVPEPKLLFVISKTYATPQRIISVLSLVAVFSMAYPTIAKLAPPLTRVLSLLGRNSLYVFCVGSLLSLACQILRYVYKGNILADTAMVVAGIAIMVLSAWLADKRERKRPA